MLEVLEILKVELGAGRIVASLLVLGGSPYIFFKPCSLVENTMGLGRSSSSRIYDAGGPLTPLFRDVDPRDLSSASRSIDAEKALDLRRSIESDLAEGFLRYIYDSRCVEGVPCGRVIPVPIHGSPFIMVEVLRNVNVGWGYLDEALAVEPVYSVSASAVAGGVSSYREFVEGFRRIYESSAHICMDPEGMIEKVFGVRGFRGWGKAPAYPPIPARVSRDPEAWSVAYILLHIGGSGWGESGVEIHTAGSELVKEIDCRGGGVDPGFSEKPQICPHCGYISFSREAFKRHIQNIHRKQAQQNRRTQLKK